MTGACLLVHHEAGVLAELTAAVARELGGEIWVGCDGEIPDDVPIARRVVIPMYPHASTRSSRCRARARGTWIVWFAYLRGYVAAVADAIGPCGDALVVFVAEDLEATSGLYPRDVAESAAQVAALVGVEHELVYFGGEAHGHRPHARDRIPAIVRDRRIVLAPLTYVVECADTAAIDRELVPLARAHGALDVVRAPAIGTRIAGALARLARDAIDPNVD